MHNCRSAQVSETIQLKIDWLSISLAQFGHIYCEAAHSQCDQIGRFNGLWASF